MTEPINLPDWAAILTSILVLLGAGLTLIGTIGLLRLDNFYARVHAPTLGTTLGIGCILIASMLYFSVLQSRPVLHEILIAIFVTITTPITLMLLVAPRCVETGMKAAVTCRRNPPRAGNEDAPD